MVGTDQVGKHPDGRSAETSTPKEKKKPPANLTIPPKKPKLTKAERRALQEQQRAVKAAKSQQSQGKTKQGKLPESSAKKDASQGQGKTTIPQPQASQRKNADVTLEEPSNGNTVDLFAHLPQFRGKTEPEKTLLHIRALDFYMIGKTGSLPCASRSSRPPFNRIDLYSPPLCD